MPHHGNREAQARTSIPILLPGVIHWRPALNTGARYGLQPLLQFGMMEVELTGNVMIRTIFQPPSRLPSQIMILSKTPSTPPIQKTLEYCHRGQRASTTPASPPTPSRPTTTWTGMTRSGSTPTMPLRPVSPVTALTTTLSAICAN